MIGDPWPEEPDEPLVEKFQPDEEGDPAEELAPAVDIDAETEVPPDLRRAFWSLVATINVGLFATSLGLMLIGFRGEWRNGGIAVLLGAGVLALAGYRYRRYQRDEHTWGDGNGGSDDTESATGDDRND